MTKVSGDQKICIIGGGLGGLSMAALLGQSGFDVICIDAEPLTKQLSKDFDGRTTAVSYGSRAVLERAGVWAGLSKASTPIHTIDILDGDSASTMTFDATEINAEAFGWIVENSDLRHALIKRVQHLKTVTHMTGVAVRDLQFHEDFVQVILNDGQSIKVALVIGADGRKSLVRDMMRVGTWGRMYHQTAIVCLVTHEKPHNNLAVEHFRREGPFALLPYTNAQDGKYRSALVWSVHGGDAQKWIDCDTVVFNAALQERAGDRFGKIEVAGRREAWPLNLVKSYSYVKPRAVLVAEAAHGMHPIAGQGLNMTLRDIDALGDILTIAKTEARDIGHIDVLKAYQRARRMDNLAMCMATDGLTLLFSNDFLPVTMLRRAGLSAVKRLPFAKRFFMHQAMGLKKPPVN
jgi:2-octaprenyl-6-methoxyphenol hydroxylase